MPSLFVPTTNQPQRRPSTIIQSTGARKSAFSHGLGQSRSLFVWQRIVIGRGSLPFFVVILPAARLSLLFYVTGGSAPVLHEVMHRIAGEMERGWEFLKGEKFHRTKCWSRELASSMSMTQHSMHSERYKNVGIRQRSDRCGTFSGGPAKSDAQAIVASHFQRNQVHDVDRTKHRVPHELSHCFSGAWYLFSRGESCFLAVAALLGFAACPARNILPRRYQPLWIAQYCDAEATPPCVRLP